MALLLVQSLLSTASSHPLSPLFPLSSPRHPPPHLHIHLLVLTQRTLRRLHEFLHNFLPDRVAERPSQGWPPGIRVVEAPNENHPVHLGGQIVKRWDFDFFKEELK